MVTLHCWHKNEESVEESVWQQYIDGPQSPMLQLMVLVHMCVCTYAKTLSVSASVIQAADRLIVWAC